ncbi:sugar kinase, partial [Candidatus Woesearchaeota archaeon]|nr:sugar kinase [Candidatus Woesearchaeota archaeon]
EFIFLANASPTNQRAQLKQFPKRKLVVADTMNLWIENEHDELIKLIKEVDGLVLNYDEAEQLTGKRNTVAAAKHLLELGPRFVVVKKGEHGCLFAHKDGIGALPAYPAEKVVDPTGAGDTFAGGMMGFLAAQDSDDPASFENIRASLAHGTIMASFTIEQFSLERLQELKKEELETRFKEFTKMLHL